MREVPLQLSLSQTQRTRLQIALQKLQDLASKSTASVTVADTIPVNNEDGILKGHGTTDFNGEVVATVCGVVERVNKLVYVRAQRARYKPEVGDIIVGRVLEIAPKRWRLEINYSQDAVLMLSSMNLPDGIQAEVRGFQHDGSLQLQARSQKYGKLERGQLLSVPAYLVKLRKHHFHHLENYGVDLILGCNGFVWVGEHVEPKDNDMAEDQESRPDGTNREQEQSFTPSERRQHICRIANAVRLLSALGFTLSAEVVVETAEASVSSGIAIKDMLGAEFCVQTAEQEARRRLSRRRN